ncbi:transmembrane 7 superfamily member 3-like protein, partial [Dinothrombium tinctorium]
NHDFIANTTFKSTIKLEPFTARKLDCLNIPSDAKYVLFESHLYGQNITLSYDYPYYYKKLSSQRSITGSDIGLVQILEPQATETFIWLLNPNDNIVEILVIISYHSTKEPLPGGCNLEFNVEISPFLKLYNDGIETRLEYQRASTGAPRGVSPLSCDTTNRQIVYEVYVYFMAENDYSKKETYRALQLMDNAKSVQQYGTLVKTYSFNPQTRVSMLSYPGRAVVYNVVAKFKGQEANYVPITSFGCDVNSKVDGCGRLSSIIGKILLIVLGILGLIVCFRGHKYFSFQTMFFGFIATAIPTFVLIAKYTDLSPSGNDLILRNDVNYWLVIACGILLFPILILPFGNLVSEPKKGKENQKFSFS